jgi:hypothetical protein
MFGVLRFSPTGSLNLQKPPRRKNVKLRNERTRRVIVKHVADVDRNTPM